MKIWVCLMAFWIQIYSKSDDDEVEKYLWEDTTPRNIPTPPVTMPFFEDTSLFANITAQLGTTVRLSCRVNDLRDRTVVSWLRRINGRLDLLSVGLEVYSSDNRYTATFTSPNNWQLLLHNTNEKDEGQYECQVSSHPPLAFIVFLHVVAPDLEIADERGLPIKNKFYNSGSTIELKCFISRVPQPSHFIFWKHGNRVLNYDTSRGGISVKTDILTNGAKSRLFIANANILDSGNYTCALADVASTYVYVHVLNGETPAAMQHGSGGQGVHYTSSNFTFIIFVTNIILYLS